MLLNQTILLERTIQARQLLIPQGPGDSAAHPAQFVNEITSMWKDKVGFLNKVPNKPSTYQERVLKAAGTLYDAAMAASKLGRNAEAFALLREHCGVSQTWHAHFLPLVALLGEQKAEEFFNRGMAKMPASSSLLTAGPMQQLLANLADKSKHSGETLTQILQSIGFKQDGTGDQVSHWISHGRKRGGGRDTSTGQPAEVLCVECHRGYHHKKWKMCRACFLQKSGSRGPRSPKEGAKRRKGFDGRKQDKESE